MGLIISNILKRAVVGTNPDSFDLFCLFLKARKAPKCLAKNVQETRGSFNTSLKLISMRT